MDLGLKNKNTIVTASSKGLGFACANALAIEGANVTICSRNKKNVSKGVSKISKNSTSQIKGYTCDLRSETSINHFLSTSKCEQNPTDILVINHPNPHAGSFGKVNLSMWRQDIDASLFSTIALCNSLLPSMKKRKWGRIIIISSIFAKEPDPGYIISSTLRAGLLGFAKGISTELAAFNITVNTVLAGYFSTPLLNELATKEAQKMNVDKRSIVSSWADMIPNKKIPEPEMIGDFIAFLCSAKADHITGATLVIDGGYLKNI